MRHPETASKPSRWSCSVGTTGARGRCALVIALAVTLGCSSPAKRRTTDAGVVPSGGSGGTSGTGGSGGSAGSDAAAPADSTPDRTAADAGTPLPCAVTITSSTYDPAMPGCGGVAACHGVIAYTNNSPVALNYPVIRFTVPAGVTCLRSHSSRWLITDNGATSHQCVYTTDLLAIPWNVAANGGSFRFGYDVTDGVTTVPATDIVISDGACPVPDGGLDAASGTGDAADGALDAQVDQRDGPTEARDGAGN
jgi:hypothetical protein